MATKELVFARHPCFGAARNRGRIHLPVCPVCNISCNFCVRSLNEDEDRPGVTAQVISPEEAVEVVRRGVELCPEISVAGIAGPGDTLATDHALETFRRIKKEFPGLLRCMSTNGLLLDERAEELLEVGIDTLAVTVNAVDPEIQKEICANVWYHGRRYTGIEGAQLLIENQLRGLERMAGAGVALKVNTVLIPGINDDHIETVARTVGRLGVLRYNIIPLIPQHKFAHIPAPCCEQIDGARRKAEPYVEVFHHCQHCRADAAGIPGKSDCSKQLYQKRLLQETFSHG